MNIIAELDFSSKSLEERWSRVKEDFWGDLKKETMSTVKKLIETSLAVEVQDLIGSRRWERNPNRWTYRNGYYKRNLLSSFGYIADINVPRLREGYIDFKVFNRYQRRANNIDELILGMFLNGVSTRNVKEVLTPLFGPQSVSSSLVSKVTKILDKRVQKFHCRGLKDNYEYLILDGIFINAKSPVWKKRRCILVAYGIKSILSLGNKKRYRKELIDFQVTPKGESENAWFRFLNGLYERGLKGKNLKLITIDGNNGLRNAIDTVYPQTLVGRCWVHKLRNIANKVPRRLQECCLREAKKIYRADNYSEAVREYKRWVNRWRLVVPAVKCLEDDIEELLNFYQCPKEMWVKIRTTNGIERSFREVRRRIRTMSCFQNRASVERIIYAIFHRLNKKWSPHHLGDEDREDSLFYEITQNY